MQNRDRFSIYLKKLRLHDFRIFHSLELSLHNRLTVLIGKNGAGKSTILDAISGMLEVYVHNIRHEVGSDKDAFFEETDIRLGSGSPQALKCELVSELTFENIEFGLVEDTPEADINDANREDRTKELQWQIDLSKSGYLQKATGNFDDLNDFVRSIDIKINGNEPVEIPITVYYQLSSFQTKKRPRAILPKTDRYQAFEGALSGDNSLSFEEFFEWFRRQEGIQRQKGSKTLDSIEQAVCGFLNGGGNVFSHLHIDWLNDNPNGELSIEKNNTSIYVRLLSSGEKMLFLLIVDLAMRMELINNHLENPLHGTGIVLIDEIDLHLHPAKQREVLPKLLKIFPNVQFVVTTHSPVVINNLNPEFSSVYMLKDNTAVQLAYFAGRNIAELMYEYYGIKSRPEDVQKDIDEVFSLIESEDPKQIERAKKKLSYLKTRLGEKDSAVMDATSSLELLQEIL